MKGFIEIEDGLWYKESDGTPWSTKNNRHGTEGKLKPLTSKSGGYYYVRINGKLKRWHRIVYEFFNGPIPSGLQVDHMNNITTDNRISNLQLLSNKDNSRSRLKQKNNTSGFAGVIWFKPNKKWRATIQVDGKNKYLGLFESPEAASQAYLKAKIKYHGKESIREI